MLPDPAVVSPAPLATPAIVAPIVPVTGEPATIAPPVLPPPAPIVAKAADTPDAERDALRAEVAYHRRLAESGELRSKAVAYLRQLEADGWPPELAQIQAKTWYDKETIQTQLAVVGEQQEQAAKVETARRLAAQYGVSSDALLAYSTPTAMFAAAARMGPEAKRLATLEAEVAALRAGTIPAQRVDNGRGAPGQGGTYQELLKRGGPMPSAAEIDRMTAQYVQK